MRPRRTTAPALCPEQVGRGIAGEAGQGSDVARGAGQRAGIALTIETISKVTWKAGGNADGVDGIKEVI